MDKVGKLSSARYRYAERLLERLARERGGGEKRERRECEDEKGDDGGCMTKRFCVGIVGTEKRLDHGYLLQSVASLRGIGGVGADFRTDKFFVQIRGDPFLLKEEEVHPNVRLMLDAGIDVDHFRSPYRIGETFVDAEGVKKVYRLDSNVRGEKQWFADEADDYRRAVDRCLWESPRSSYVVIVEEDVFATRDLMGKLSAAVDFLESEHEEEWSNIKLFVSDYWQNWEREPADVALLVVGGLLFACLWEVFLKAFDLAVLARRRSARKKDTELWSPSFEWESNPTAGAFQGVHVDVERGAVVGDPGGCEREKKRKGGFPSFRNRRVERAPARRKWVLRAHHFSLGIATLLAVSKQALNLSRLSRRGIYADDMGAFTQGMVFPRHVAAEIVRFLERNERPLPIDILLRNFNKEVLEGEKRQFIIVPSLLQHTGILSSSTGKVMVNHAHGDLAFYRDYMMLASKFDDLSVDELEGLS